MGGIPLYAHARAKASLLMRSLMLILVLGIVILSTVTGRAKRGLPRRLPLLCCERPRGALRVSASRS